MLLKLDMLSDIPIYTQLRNQIVIGIAKGELKEGEILPSVRKLAQDLEINLHTVNKTYNILRQEGFLSVNRRKNVVVNNHSTFMANDEYKANLEESLKIVIAESCARGMSEVEIQKFVKKISNQILGGKDNA